MFIPRIQGAYKLYNNVNNSHIVFKRGKRNRIIFWEGVEIEEISAVCFLVKGNLTLNPKKGVLTFTRGEKLYEIVYKNGREGGIYSFAVTNGFGNYNVYECSEEHSKKLRAHKVCTLGELVQEHTQGSKKAIETKEGYDIVYTYQNGSTELILSIVLKNKDEGVKYFTSSPKKLTEL